MKNKIILNNIDKIHTTILGEKRIQRNLNFNGDIIDYIKKLVVDNNSVIYQKGKNYYVEIKNIIITINSYNYCIITAHFIK